MKTLKNKTILILALFFTSLNFAQDFKEYIKQGEEKYHSGDYKGSIENFRKAVKTKPNNTDGLFSLGYVLGLRGMYDEGISYLDKAIKIAPDSILYKFYRGEIKGYNADYKGAIKDMLYYKNNSREDPEATYIFLSQYYYDDKDYKNAQLYIDKAEKALNPLPFNFYYNKARLELKNNDYLKAIQNATKSININPDYPDSYFTRARALYETGKYDKSIEDYDAYLNIIPTDDTAWSNRGLAKQMAGDLKGSIADFNKAISLYDQEVLTYLNRSASYQKMNKNDLALADLNKAAKLAPNYSKTFNNRAELLRSQEKFTDALKDFNRAISINPYVAVYYINRAYCNLDLKKFNQALSDAKEGISMAPDNSDAYLTAGIASYNLSKNQEAITYFTQGIAKHPNDGRHYYFRAESYKEMGNISAAKKDEAKAKSLLTK